MTPPITTRSLTFRTQFTLVCLSRWMSTVHMLQVFFIIREVQLTFGTVKFGWRPMSFRNMSKKYSQFCKSIVTNTALIASRLIFLNLAIVYNACALIADASIVAL